MSLLNILKYPHPILKRKANPLNAVDTTIERLIDDMIETMYDAEGIGLAAPQIGDSIKLTVMDVPLGEGYNRGDNLIVLINPEIISHEGEISYKEGCLSIPEYTADIKRWHKVSVKALNKVGEEITFEAEGLLAIAIQHEIDHLNGILFIDRISRLRRDIILRKLKKIKG